jgi:hypothetical protein
MSISGSMSLMRHASILVAALVVAAGTANAQFAHISDSSSATTESANESSSSASPLLADAAIGSDGAATPAASSGANSGGQERRSGGYQSHSFFNHMAFEAGGGFNAPANEPDLTWGGNLTVGAGYRFNPMFSLMAEYQFIDDKLPGQLIAEAGATGGNAHIWSLTLDPVVDLMPKRHNSVYVTGGGGFYRMVTNFTDPEPAEYCTYFYCGIAYQNQVVGHYSSNQGGWNIGAGYQHRFGGMYGDDSKMKVFAEVRYLDVLTPAVTTNANGLNTTSVQADTKVIPVTFGVRW